MKMVTVITGKLYMKSGSVIPFAISGYTDEENFRFNTKWDEKGNRIVSVHNWNSVPFDEISIINHISWSSVEAVVSDNEIEITEEEFYGRIGSK